MEIGIARRLANYKARELIEPQESNGRDSCTKGALVKATKSVDIPILKNVKAEGYAQRVDQIPLSIPSTSA